MSRRNNGKIERGEINKLNIMRMERQKEEIEKQKEEMERQKEERERMQRGVTFTIGQDGPFDRVARGNVQQFVPRMSFQDYVNSKNARDVQPFVPPMSLQDSANAENARDVQPFVPPMSLQDSANSFLRERQQYILQNKHLQGLAGRIRPVLPSNSELSSEPFDFELLPDPTSVKDMAEAREREGYQRYLNTYFSEIKPGYPGALFSRTATNIPDKKGGGARKKKYTQTRQKKQHRRRHRRRSTRKYKK
jgi:hypothetical protein